MSEVSNKILCVYCAEEINPQSKKCKHCGEILDPHMRDIEFLKNQRNTSQVFMNAGGGASSASSASASSSGTGNLGLRNFRHWLHIFLSVITGGLWVPIYLLLFMFRNKNVFY